MKKLGIALITTIILLSSCSTNKNTVKMTVASEKRTAMGVVPMEVMLIKEGNATDWSFFYSSIEGFDHEKGYEYLLEVQKEDVLKPIPADASSIKYTLVKEISKTQKTSENMPQERSSKQQAKYVWTAKVLELDDADVGTGAAKGKFPVQYVKLQVTALNGDNLAFKEGDIIHAELVKDSKVEPQTGGEYVFKAKESHPAHALGVYMLDTDVQDLTR